MAEKTTASASAILPVMVLGLVVGGIALYSQPEQLAIVDQRPVDETHVVNAAVEQASATLPDETPALALAERHLRLRLNDSPERTLEVAGGLYAIASKHLEQSNAPEAMRVAQSCADLAPDSLLAARCWLLCGNASAITYPDLPLSIRYFERADSALRERLLQHPSEEEALRLRASAVQWLGQMKDRFGRTEEAIQHLRELTGATPLAQIQPPQDRLRTMLTLGRLLRKNGPVDEANRLLSAALEFGKSDAVPAAEALHALLDATRLLSPAVAEPARQDALRDLWDTSRFIALPEWFQIGDELASSYFFHVPRQGADFDIVSRQLLITLPGGMQSLPADSDQRPGLESLYATNLLLAVDFARDRSDASEVARLVTLFESNFQGQDIQFSSPLDRPAQRMHHIGEIYRTTMTGHVEQLRQLQATGTTPR